MEICDYCNEEKEDVSWGVNPFAYEIHGDETEMWMCDECYTDAAMEI